MMCKKFLVFSAFAFILSMLFFQCRKNEDISINDNYQPVFVLGGVYGNVVNELGRPESNVKVSNGTISVMTDQNGVFILQNQLFDKAGTQIKFEKAGYYTIYKIVIPIKDQMVCTNLKLVRKTLTKFINAAIGDVVVANGNSQIKIPANSIVDASGKTYSGQAQVFAYWIDPTDTSMTVEMPGNLTGRNLDGKETALQTLGMMSVELEDMSGNPLNITSNKTVELKFPIPVSKDLQAKATIPLWLYDATKGSWIENGIASKQGNYYVTQVKDLSFSNCAYAFPVSKLKGQVLDESGKKLGNTILEIYDETNKQQFYYTTTSGGEFELKSIASSSFTMNIGRNQCQNPFAFKFTTNTTDQDLGLINTTLNSVRLYGSIIDCTNRPSSAGYIKIWFDNLDHFTIMVADPLGRFDVNGLICLQNDWNYRTIDFKNRSQSNINSVSFQNQKEFSIGNSKTCNSQEDYIIIYVDDVPKEYVLTQLPPSGNIKFDLEGQKDSSLIRLQIILPAIDLVNSIQPRSFNYLNNSYSFKCTSGCLISVKLEQYGPIGGQVKGSFSGTMTNAINSMEAEIHGGFNVTRKY